MRNTMGRVSACALFCDAGRSLQVSISPQATLAACWRLELQGQAAPALLNLAKQPGHISVAQVSTALSATTTTLALTV